MYLLSLKRKSERVDKTQDLASIWIFNTVSLFSNINISLLYVSLNVANSILQQSRDVRPYHKNFLAK